MAHIAADLSAKVTLLIKDMIARLNLFRLQCRKRSGTLHSVGLQLLAVRIVSGPFDEVTKQNQGVDCRFSSCSCRRKHRACTWSGKFETKLVARRHALRHEKTGHPWPRSVTHELLVLSLPGWGTCGASQNRWSVPLVIGFLLIWVLCYSIGTSWWRLDLCLTTSWRVGEMV